MNDYSVEEIIKAKQVAKANGYEVSLPTDDVEQAMNIAKAAGYTVKDPSLNVKPTYTKPTKTKAPTVFDIAAKYL